MVHKKWLGKEYPVIPVEILNEEMLDHPGVDEYNRINVTDDYYANDTLTWDEVKALFYTAKDDCKMTAIDLTDLTSSVILRRGSVQVYLTVYTHHLDTNASRALHLSVIKEQGIE